MGFNPYFTGLPILISSERGERSSNPRVSILILLDYLFLEIEKINLETSNGSFNPYFTGLPILIMKKRNYGKMELMFQSLFYWITYSYPGKKEIPGIKMMFQSLFYWITYS